MCHDKINIEHKERLLGQLDPVMHWQIILYLPQMIPELQFSPDESAEYLEAARPFVNHNRPFIRVVALRSITVLAEQHPTEQIRI